MHSTRISLPLFVTVLSMHTFSVNCKIRPSVEEIASDYIVSRLFPSHSNLARKLLDVLVKSVENSYKDEQQRQMEEQIQYNDDVEDVDDNSVRIPDDRSDESRNAISSEDDDISETGISSSARDSIEGIIRRADMRQHQLQQQQQQQQQEQQRQRFGFGRRPRRLQTQKRGLGHCIHKCINGSGHMNFIQCKSMCH